MTDDDAGGHARAGGPEPANGGDRSTEEDPLARAEEAIEKIRTKEDEEDLGPLLAFLDDLEDVLDEAEDALSTMDPSEVVEAVDWAALPEAIDASDLADAVREGNPADAVDSRALLAALDLSKLLDGVDERELWREKRQLDEEVDDLTGERSADASGAGDATGGVDVDVDRESPDDEVDPRAVQTSVQREVSGAVGEFREKLIEAHERLDRVRAENEARFDERRTKSDSRNPTAGFSTLPSNHAGAGGRTRHSTVPEETKYSTAPNRKRIYGDRFESAGGDGSG